MSIRRNNGQTRAAATARFARAIVPLAAWGCLLPTAELSAQGGNRTGPAPTFQSASDGIRDQLEASTAELRALMDQIAEEKIPLNKRLNELVVERDAVRREYQDKARLVDRGVLDINVLKQKIKAREDEAQFVSNQLNLYQRNFDTRIHVSEIQRFSDVIEAAKLAAENTNLTDHERIGAQAALVAKSIDRLEDLLGGVVFEGSAVDGSSLVSDGRFVMLGPAVIFQSDSGREVGTAEQRLGSLEPTIIGFDEEDDDAAAKELVATGAGEFPLDPTLGDAHQVAATKETLVEHIQKGGPVMWAIGALAAVSLLLGAYKFLALAFVGRPARRQMLAVLEAVAERDDEAVVSRAKRLSGPIGQMIAAGAANLRQPREIIEESMYETMLTARMRFLSLLPYIAVIAAAAPLVGLLGTVLGIIETFKLISVFGAGDPKTLSSGISAALITTEAGLVVAIPSLLMHAFLLRWALGKAARMESAGIAFINQVSKSYPESASAGGGGLLGGGIGGEAPAQFDVRGQVREVLTELLGPLDEASGSSGSGNGNGEGRSAIQGA